MATAEQSLPHLDDGEIVDVVNVHVLSKKTRPPSHYTEGTLLDDMKAAAKFVENYPDLKRILKEASGLGTAATRDSIIEGLKNDRYIEKKGKHLVATQKGLAFISWLDQLAPELTDVAVTARWEAELGVIAQEGGGSAFESKVAELVRALVATFKTAPALVGAPPSTKESSTMSNTETPQRTSKPTDKMLEFAKSIAKKLGQQVPDNVMADFEACKAYIDSNKEAAMRPSEKQLKFATSIAERKGLTLPPEVAANGRELSKWIDANL